MRSNVQFSAMATKQCTDFRDRLYEFPVVDCVLCIQQATYEHLGEKQANCGNSRLILGIDLTSHKCFCLY